VSSDGAKNTIDIRILGLPMTCWKCGSSTTAIVGAVPVDDDVWLFTRASDDAVLSFIARALPEGVAGVGALNERASKTAGIAYLSNGCSHCDALLGNFFIFHEELLDFLNTEGAEELSVVTTVSVSMDQWDQVRDR
jgi:hypothetical protein